MQNPQNRDIHNVWENHHYPRQLPCACPLGYINIDIYLHIYIYTYIYICLFIYVSMCFFLGPIENPLSKSLASFSLV